MTRAAKARNDLKPEIFKAAGFLERLRPHGPVLLIAIHPDKKWTPACSCTTREQMEDFVLLHNKNNGCGVYYHINLARAGLDKKACKEDMEQAEFLHVDADPHDAETPEQCWARLQPLIKKYDKTPTFIIKSGNGVHLLWRLKVPVPLDGDAAIADIEARNYALAIAFGADPSTRNIDRIFRVPFTINLPNEAKRKLGRVPVKSELIEANDVAYDLADFPHNSSDEQKGASAMKKVDLGNVKLDTSKAFSRTVRRLADQGLDPEQIVNTLRKHKDGKYRDTKTSNYDRRGEGKLLQFVSSEYGRWRESKPPEVLKVKWTNGAVPKSCLADTKTAIKALGVDLQHDIFHDVVLYDGRPLDNHQEVDLRNRVLESFKFDPGKEHVHDAILMIARENITHPVIDYLDELKWDGTERLDNWVCVYLGVADTPLTRTIGRKSLIAAVRRVKQPGVKFDQIIVLEGPQGTGKSTAIEILAGEDNFSDQTLLGLNDQRQQEQMKGIWLYEIAELAGMRNADVEKHKSFASRRTNRGRPAYGRVVEWLDRTCVLFGTTNDDQYLIGDNKRRMWPLKTTEIQLDALRRDRDQLWAEATAAEAAGEHIELPGDLWPAASIEQEKRRETDPWEEKLAEIGGNLTPNGLEERISTAELFEELGLKAKDQRVYDTKRLSRCMKALGWQGPDKLRIYRNQAPVNGYRRDAAPERTAPRKKMLSVPDLSKVEEPRKKE